jgi:hypothetical protein
MKSTYGILVKKILKNIELEDLEDGKKALTGI